MKAKVLFDHLDATFLPEYQETYDNAGFLIGDGNTEINGVLVALDVTDAVVDEAIAKGFNVIVSHHPIIFGGIKRITTSNPTGQLITKLIKNNIAVYAAHTNLDNLQCGVNGILAEKIGLCQCQILRPMDGVLRKLVTYVPISYADNVRSTLFAAGAGHIASNSQSSYDCCSFNSDGEGTFRAGNGSNPFCGEIGHLHHEKETRIEVIYEKRIERQLLQQLREAHPYEEPAIDCFALTNPMPTVGSGMIGFLQQAMTLVDFYEMVKKKLNLPFIRTSKESSSNTLRSVKKIAICGGAGGFLLNDAKAKHADIFLTSDLKYHDFQAAANDIILADIGHFESEQFAKEIIYRTISEKFCNFVCQISSHGNSYISYM